MHKKKWVEWFWDGWCIISIVGIWPRFIEPKLPLITKLSLPLPNLPQSLEGLRLLQISDLHWHANFSTSFCQKLIKKINGLNPDLLVFTGDFLSRSKLENPIGLQNFLCSLTAKFGCFATLGNHDYESYVTVNEQGDYDIERDRFSTNLKKGFKRLFFTTPLSKNLTLSAQQVGMHSELIKLLEKTPFQLLHNSSKMVSLKGSGINICGLGEYTLGRCLPHEAFEMYDERFPGIVLTHNPDAVPELLHHPGDLILAGHTHGGQVNLPLMRKKFTQIEQMHLLKGLKKLGNKWIYINRGIGSIMPFRWFSPPELTLVTLCKGFEHG